MNVALKIHKELDKKADLKLIKKVISLYEKLKQEDDDELMTYDDAMEHLNDLLGEVTAADKVKAFRGRENMTQKELAKKSDIAQQHISEIERGTRPVGVTTAKKLASALNCDYRSLL
jgi:DNA-binding XRE family transcriptional regulator